MSLIYHYGVSRGYISLNRFVELTSTAPAKISACSRRKARSPSAATPTSSSLIRARGDDQRFQRTYASRQYRLQRLRRLQGEGLYRNRIVTWQGRHRERQLRRPRRGWRLCKAVCIWRAIRQHPRQHGARRARAKSVAGIAGSSDFLTRGRANGPLDARERRAPARSGFVSDANAKQEGGSSNGRPTSCIACGRPFRVKPIGTARPGRPRKLNGRVLATI